MSLCYRSQCGACALRGAWAWGVHWQGDAIVSLTDLRVVTRTTFSAALFAAFVVSAALSTSGARAAEPIFAPGEPIVTGFSGVVAPTIRRRPATRSARLHLHRSRRPVDGHPALQPDGPPAGQLIRVAAGVRRDSQGCRPGLRRHARQRARDDRRRRAQHLSGGDLGLRLEPRRPEARRQSGPQQGRRPRRDLHARPVGQRGWRRRLSRQHLEGRWHDRRDLAVHHHRGQ